MLGKAMFKEDTLLPSINVGNITGLVEDQGKGLLMIIKAQVENIFLLYLQSIALELYV